MVPDHRAPAHKHTRRYSAIAIENSSAIYQAVIRFARTLFAAGISALALAVPEALGVFNLDGTSFAFVVMILTAGLNGLGKLVRGETVPAPGVEPVASAKLPI